MVPRSVSFQCLAPYAWFLTCTTNDRDVTFTAQIITITNMHTPVQQIVLCI